MNAIVTDFSGGSLETNYWTTEWSLRGIAFCAVRARVFHILLPMHVLANGQTPEEVKSEMLTGKTVLVSRRDGGYMFMFDDGSETPFALLLDPRQLSTPPAQSDSGRTDVTVQVHTADGWTHTWSAEVRL